MPSLPTRCKFIGFNWGFSTIEKTIKNQFKLTPIDFCFFPGLFNKGLPPIVPKKKQLDAVYLVFNWKSIQSDPIDLGRIDVGQKSAARRH